MRRMAGTRRKTEQQIRTEVHMDQPGREAEPFFTQPVRQFLLMGTVLVLTGIGCYIAYPRVAPVFLANPWLNGFIFLVFVIGILACFWQVIMIAVSVDWIVHVAEGRPAATSTKPPRLLAPLSQLLKSHGQQIRISPTSARSILDSVATRIDELRDLTRYIVSLLVFLGLLGTFYGLATTVPAVVDTIRSLAPQEGAEGITVFNNLISGLEAQLGGMGVAFASSLLGLAGSLVVGLLELFAGHGQNRFYRELEEWLSTITRLGVSFGDGDSAGEQEAQDTSISALSQIAEQMTYMRATFQQVVEDRMAADSRIAELASSMDLLTQHLKDDQSVAALERIVEGQAELLRLLAEREGAVDGFDAESRMRMRSIDVQLLRILEELATGRQETTADLRKEISALTKAVRQLADH